MNNGNITIRKASEDDYSAVNSLYFETYNLYHNNIPASYKKTPKPTLPRGTFISIIDDKNVLMIVAEIKDKVVGMLYATIEEYKGDEWSMPYNRVSIDELSVLPNYQGKGIGSLLMQEVENWAKRKKVSDLTVLVYEFNDKAIKFYQNNGYDPYSIKLNKKIS